MEIYKTSLQDLKDKLKGRSQDQVCALFKGVGVETDSTKSVEEQCEQAHAQFQTKLSGAAPSATPLPVAPPASVADGDPAPRLGLPSAPPVSLAPEAPDHKVRARTGKRRRAGRNWTSSYVLVRKAEFSKEQWESLESDPAIQIKAI